MHGAPAPPPVAFTFDLHDVDQPEDIVFASRWFHDAGLPATFFVPTSMLLEKRWDACLRLLPELGHEVASHGHLHDWAEIDALMSGRPGTLGFLARSHELHARYFGAAPRSFRSPRWCTLSRAAIVELARLGYSADSSATPQRVPLLSSLPLHPGWWASPRGIHALAPGLYEIPTSTWLVPAGAPSFLTLRTRGSLALIGQLARESKGLRSRPLVLQFHVEDFTPGSRRDRDRGRPGWRDLGWRRRGGWQWKVFLRDTDPVRIVETHRAIVASLAEREAVTISALAREAASREADAALPRAASA